MTLDFPALLSRIEAGDPEAEGALLEHFAPRVRVMAQARTRDADLARDLTQEALMALLLSARKGQIRDVSRTEAFVAGIARNVINNHKRKALRHPESPLDEQLPLVTVDDHGASDRRRLVAQAMSALSISDRRILMLTLVEGLKPGEIAGRVGESAEVVRTRKSRALKRVVEALDALSQNALARHLP